MNIEQVRDILFWCTIINYGILLVSVLIFVLGPHWRHEMWSGWIGLSEDQRHAIHFAGITIYGGGHHAI